MQFIETFTAVSHKAVTAAIDGEREHQIKKWTASDGTNFAERSVAELTLFTEEYLDETIIAYLEAGSNYNCLDAVRKVLALAVACLEKHSYQGFKNPRLAVYEMFEESSEISNAPYEETLNTYDLSMDLMLAKHELRLVRHQITHKKGNDLALEWMHKFAMSMYAIMRYYGAVRRFKPLLEPLDLGV